jgi:hypothetical protein
LHWLPKTRFRRILQRLGQTELAKEENLNLMTERDFRKAVEGVSDRSFIFDEARLLGLRSNLVLFGRRNA